MIKVQATINGVISKSGTIRMAGDGKKFIGCTTVRDSR